MANKFVKYIVALLACWCCCTVNVYCQNNAGQDSAVVDSAAVELNSDSMTQADANKSALEKFSLKDKQDIVTERQLPDSGVQKIKKDKDFWYANKGTGEKKEEDKTDEDTTDHWYNSGGFNFLFWAIVISAFVGLIAMYLINSNVWLFASRSKKIYGNATKQEEETDNIFALDFDARISKAESANDYRLATRLLFLRVLRSMSEKNIINYGIDKTNMDYLFELNRTSYFKEFAQASRTYEYVWYGNFDVQQSQFNFIKEHLQTLNQKITA